MPWLYFRGWIWFRFADLSFADGRGLEIFEFANNDVPAFVNPPFKTGVFHFQVQDPNMEGMLKRIVEAGGKQTSPIHERAPAIERFFWFTRKTLLKIRLSDTRIAMKAEYALTANQ